MKGVPGTVYDIVAVTDIVTPDGTVRAEAGSVVQTLTTGADGRATSGELYLGQYQLVERSVPAGFVLDENPIPFELSYEDQHTALVSEMDWHQNERQKALVKLNKTAETLENQSYNPYPDIVFGLYSGVEFLNSKGDVVLAADSLLEIITLDEDGTGTITTDLPFAVYYVKELAAGNGYYLNGESYEFTLTHEDVTTPVVEITVGGEDGIPNELMRGAIRINKAVEGDGSLEGFAFRIAGTTINGTPVEIVAETDANGEIHIPDMPLGEYEVTELTNERTVGYILPDSQTVTVELGDPAELTFGNLLIRGGFHLLKVDADDHDKRLDGAVFGLYTVDGDLLVKTDEDGKRLRGAVFELYAAEGDELVGTYTSNRKGIKLDSSPIKFTIDAKTTKNGTVLVELTATNKATPEPTGGVRLVKVDAANKDTTLKGAVFEFYSGTTMVGIYTTNDKGVIEVTGLAYGDYRFVEKTAPEGYELSTTEIKFTVDATTTKDGTVLVVLTATNKAKTDTPSTSKPTTSNPSTSTTTQTGKGDSPKTGDTSNLLLPIILLLGGAAGLTVALVKRRKTVSKGKTKKYPPTRASGIKDALSLCRYGKELMKWLFFASRKPRATRSCPTTTYATRI